MGPSPPPSSGTIASSLISVTFASSNSVEGGDEQYYSAQLTPGVDLSLLTEPAFFLARVATVSHVMT